VRPRASALVGRDNELRSIEQALNSARDARGRAIFLVGEGGIGKTRLATAAADFALGAGMRLLRGRGSGIGPSMPFRPLAEALLGVLRSSSVEDFDVTELGPYLPALGALVPDWGDRADSQPAQPAGSLLVLAEAVLRVAMQAGRGRGCLMVFDDLQDADAETLSVIDYLVDNLDQQPTVLIGTVRTQPSPALDLARSAAQRGACTLIELGRLSPADVARLVASCMDCPTESIPAELVDRVWEDSAGNPFYAEELLGELISSKQLTQRAGAWHLSGGGRPTGMPITLARIVSQRIDALGPQARETLLAAAVLGRRFPLTVLQLVTGMDDRNLLSNLHAAVTAQLVAPDTKTPDWYAFQHPLIAEALLSILPPAQRIQTTRRAAEAVEAAFPGLPGEWCQLAAALRLQAGDRDDAGAHLLEAGRRALDRGAAHSAVAFLDQAQQLVHDDVGLMADVLESLPYALAEAGLVERALACVADLDRVGHALDISRRARLHTRLAWAANVAGRPVDGLAQVERARQLLGPDASNEDTAHVDVVAAHLVLDAPGQDRMERAEAMALRAATVAEAVPLPVVACQAWQLLAALVRWRDLDAATTCLERSRSIAIEHRLPIWEIHALVRLGNDDAMRTASVERLEQVRRQAIQVGAVTAACQAEQSLALQAVLTGDFARSAEHIDAVAGTATRLKLIEILQYVLLTRAILEAHQGRRRAMERAIAEFRECGGEQSHHASRLYGLGRSFCALLEENRSRARSELAHARAIEGDSPGYMHLSGQHGIGLLLDALHGDAGWAEYEAVAGSVVSRLRWNHQFVLHTQAVLAARAGRPGEAEKAVAEAIDVAEPFPMARHLCLRLVAEEALGSDSGGWGHPVEWLRGAEEYFHGSGVAPVSGACRALLRRAGVPVPQRRDGVDSIPGDLRAAGLTAREYEVLQLLGRRLTNREIAGALHLSTRTVEKHVGSLITKTGQSDRIALARLASGGPPTGAGNLQEL